MPSKNKGKKLSIKLSKSEILKESLIIILSEHPCENSRVTTVPLKPLNLIEDVENKPKIKINGLKKHKHAYLIYKNLKLCIYFNFK